MEQHLIDLFNQIPDDERILIKGYIANQYREITCVEFRRQVMRIAHFLVRQGISKGDRIAVISPKEPQSIIAFFGVLCAQGVVVPICETLSTRELSYIFKDSETNIILCHESLADSLGKISEPLEIRVIPFCRCLEKNDYAHSSLIVSSYQPDDPAFLIYTSGSMGSTKGVLLSHRNLAVNGYVSANYADMRKEDVMMSLLPYWHSFALTAEIFAMVSVGGMIAIPKSKTTLLKDMAFLQPTMILSIPRLAEMLKDTIEAGVAKKSKIEQCLFKIAQASMRRINRIPDHKRHWWQHAIAHVLRIVFFKKIKEVFGGRFRHFIGGGAPLDTCLQEFFFSVDLPMYQGYGLTETAPVISINAPHDFKIGTAGKIIPWLTPQMGGDFTFEDAYGNRGKHLKGELLVKGMCTMLGYWHLPEDTAAVCRDGWLATQDMGYLDEDGHLILYGRKRNLVCLKNGKKFYPEWIEERLKISPYILQSVVVGEGADRPSVLVNVNEELCAAHSASAIYKLIQAEIRRLTADFEPHQRPARHLVVPEFTQEEGLLTNTQKVRRHKIIEKYKEQIVDLLQG